MQARDALNYAALIVAHEYPRANVGETSIFTHGRVRLLVSMDPTVHAVLAALVETMQDCGTLQGFRARLDVLASVEP